MFNILITFNYNLISKALSKIVSTLFIGGTFFFYIKVTKKRHSLKVNIKYTVRYIKSIF